ncbi:PfkB family carbohydrate kinase [Breoghania corrubedonensis]|uniref:PfkB family carbohydrate kinase n=1 Tax=Breoghania corrubedonensis TaxID=665038 RepID=UPI001AECE4B6|nr:PfkB family carbohydrate kinase [Breoghania corrubedonensis]
MQSIDAAHEGAGSRAGAPHVSENGVSRAGGGAALCVALCGGIHLDRLAHADRRILPDTSTPGRILTRPGGVATNVAMVLARLAIPARLFGRIGRDGDGDTLSAVLARRGIDMSGVREGKGATASYLALHDPGGRLAAAVVDDAITFEFAPDDLPPAALAQAAIWFADANLRADTLERLAKLAGARGTGVLLVADAVSIAKARRLEPVLGRLDLLFANRAEAAALVGTPGTAETLARALVDMEDGPRAAIVTDGESGAALAQTGNKTCLHRTALPARVVDVTGAGDALTGGTLAGLAWGLDLAQALDYGRAAAALTVEATGAAPESLTLAALHLRLDAVEAD